MYDVVIVGGGPAGLTAGLYTARRSMKTLIVSKDIGGQAASTNVIENYPGVAAVDGLELMQNFKSQAEEYGAEFILGEVSGLKKMDAGFAVHYNNVSVETRTVILAFGLTPRSVGVPGEQEFTGRGVSYSTAADIVMAHDKNVVVIGGGNSAVESANLLAAVAKKVYLVHRRDRFRAEAVLIKEMESHDNIELVLNAELTEVHGNEGDQDENDDKVIGVVVKLEDGTERTLDVEGVFVNVGFMSQTTFVKDLVNLTSKNEIIVETDGRTSLEGVFAAGDITTASHKQVVTSAGDGCKAALTCYSYMMALDGKEVKIDQDWDVAATTDHFIRT